MHNKSLCGTLKEDFYCWIAILSDSAGQNKQHSAAKNTAKLDRETEELHHDKIGMDVGKLIQQGRSEKKLTQKELATVRAVVMFRSECVDQELAGWGPWKVLR